MKRRMIALALTLACLLPAGAVRAEEISGVVAAPVEAAVEERDSVPLYAGEAEDGAYAVELPAPGASVAAEPTSDDSGTGDVPAEAPENPAGEAENPVIEPETPAGEAQNPAVGPEVPSEEPDIEPEPTVITLKKSGKAQPTRSSWARRSSTSTRPCPWRTCCG